MSHQSSHDTVRSSSYDFKGFIRTIEKKNLVEIISCADQEATDAWRSAYQRRKAADSGESPFLYACILEELVAFLRAAVVYRPINVTEEIFDQFLQLRRTVTL